MAGVADKNALKAGLFVLASIAVAIAVFVLVSDRGAGRGERWLISFDLDQDIGGLAAGNEVRVGGLKKGQVADIELNDDGSGLMVAIDVPDEIVFRQGTKAVVQSTVTGVAWINFTDLGTGEPISPGTPIQGTTSGLGDAIAAIEELTPEIKALAADLRSETIPRVSTLLDKGATTLDSADTAFKSADRAVVRIDDMLAGNEQRVNETLESLRVSSARIPELMDQAETLVESFDAAAKQLSETLEGTGTRLDDVLEKSAFVAESAQEATEDASIALREVRSMIQGNRGKIEQIIARTTDASRTMSLAMQEIRRSPWRLLYKPSGEQRESIDLYDSARQFAEGASALQDAAIALQDASNDPNADKEAIQMLLNELQERFNQFDRIEKQFFERIR